MIYGSYNDSGGNDTISNSGSVGGSIYGGRGDDTINNSGIVDGSISGGDGNDAINLQVGSFIGGNLDGGLGTDSLTLSGSGTVQTTTVNFEFLDLNNNGTWNFEEDVDLGNTGIITVTDGTLNFLDSLVAGSLDISSATANINGKANINGQINADGQLYIFSEGNLYAEKLDVGEEGLVNLNGYLRSSSTRNWGTFLLNTTLESPLFNHGFLGGNGTVTGNITNYGTISPGNSIGTIAIHGNYTHKSSAIYLAEINSNGRNDMIDISGSARLNGGTVKTNLPRAL